MEYKKLGHTDIEVSRIGFGSWAIGGHGYGKVDDNESIRAIQKALDLGINFFDTADVYGFGHSEEILSKALGSQRHNVVIASKFGVCWDENGNIYKNCSPKRVREALEGSLRRLRMDCIPLYQIHWYDNETKLSDTIEVLKGYQEEGKINHIGCSNFSADLLLEATKTARIESLQYEYNLIRKNLEVDILKCSDELEIGIIAYNVLARGLLTGKYDLTTKFDDMDTRSKDQYFQGKNFLWNLTLVHKLKQIASCYGVSPANVAIRWALTNPAITCAIIGAKTDAQVEENALAMELELNTKDIDILNVFGGHNIE